MFKELQYSKLLAMLQAMIPRNNKETKPKKHGFHENPVCVFGCQVHRNWGRSMYRVMDEVQVLFSFSFRKENGNMFIYDILVLCGC